MNKTLVAKELVRIAKMVSAGSTADDLFDSVMMDMWPRQAAIVDFGLDGMVSTSSGQMSFSRAAAKLRYEALYYPIRNGEITKDDLRRVVGDGPAITKLTSRCRTNPHKGIKFETAYDGL